MFLHFINLLKQKNIHRISLSILIKRKCEFSAPRGKKIPKKRLILFDSLYFKIFYIKKNQKHLNIRALKFLRLKIRGQKTT